MTESSSRPRPEFSRWTFVLGAAALLAVLPALATPAPPATDSRKATTEARQAAVAVAAAQEAIERKDYSTAATLLENFLLEHPGHPQVLLNLAYCYTLLGRTADARETYRQTLEVNPELFSARLNLGLLLLDDDQPVAAATQLKQALELEPDNYEAQFYMATALERSGEKEQALVHYRRAARLDPEQGEPLQAIVDLQLERGELAEAEKALVQLMELTPDQPALLRLHADLLLRQGKSQEALAAYEAYLKRQPEDAPLHVTVGQLYREQGKLEDALRHFAAAEQAAATADSAPLGAREHAETLAALERWRQAIPLYRKALAADPDNAELHAALGYAYLKERQYEPASRELLAAINLDPANVEAYNHLASALYLSGHLPGTIEILERRARHAEETPGTLFLRAVCYDKLDQCEPAIDYYEKFLALNDDQKSDQYFLATARLRLLKKSCRRRRR